MELSEEMVALMAKRAKLEETLGKQSMQTAVLKWALKNTDGLSEELSKSLVDAMTAERQS